MKKNGWKRLLAVALALILALSLMPAAFATGAGEGETPAPTGIPAPTGTPAPTEAPAACTKTEGCTLTDGHEGDCVPVEKKPDEIPAAVQTFLGAVASIVIPEEVNEETGPVLNEQIGAAQNAYDALSEEELAREDVQAAVEKLTAAIKALNGGPKTLEETAVAKIGETEYMTLDEAVTAAADGDTIELLADCVTAGFNLSKNLIIDGKGKTITFTQYGIALWGTALSFNNCNVVMTGIGSTPYTAEWNRMAICASQNASLTLNGSTMSMDGTGTSDAHAIYFCSNNKLNLNASTLRISNYVQDALEWNRGDGNYNINLTGYVNSVDKALYLTYEAYSAAAAKYHCYAMAAGTKSGGQYLWGPSFMSFLANGKTVDFSQIRNDILYLVDSGSRVEDYMGYVADDYDFDFVKPEEMTLKVGSESYAAVKLSENEYGFKPVNGSYAFRVEYVRGNGHEEEHFVWYINEAISNFAPVQLTYTVRLTNPKAEPGTYGEYDRDGSTDSTELYTNNSAVLYPVDSNGKEGEALPFPKPTVSYTVEPKKLEVSVTKVWDDCNDNDGYRPDSVTVSLLADGEPTGKTLVLSEANQWMGSFKELDLYADGEEIVYTVTEDAVSKYTTVITNGQDSATDFIITNSHVPETMSIPVVKRWNDNNDANDRRPGSITVYLYANGEATGEKLRITARNGWVGEFENLPVYANGKAIDYSIREKSMYFYSGAVSSNPNGGFIITNTYTTSPGTGDSGNIGLWIALASVSLIAMGASLVMVKKKETGK